MAYGADGAENFEISHVISRAFGAIGANFLLYFLLSAILSGLPAFGLAWWEAKTGVGAASLAPGNPVLTTGYWILLAATMVVSLLTGAVLQAALTRATVANLAGEQPAFGPTLAAGISMMPATVAISLLSTLALSLVAIVFVIPAVLLVRFGGVSIALLPLLILGLVCLALVPMILLSLRWLIAVPAYVQERVGVFRSFGRSNRLTKGARGKIFLTVLIIVVGVGILQFVMGLLGGVAGGVGGTVIAAAVTGVSTTLSGMVTSTTYASIYVELRDVKEGIEPHALETIFA